MRDFFYSLKIRVKLLAAFGSILLLSVFLIYFSIRSIRTILDHKQISEQVDLLKLHLEALELSEREFLYEGYKSESFLKEQISVSLENFNNNYEQSKLILKELEQSPISASSPESISKLQATLDSLGREFGILVELLKKRGFRDYGSEGALRTAIHQVENASVTIDKVVLLTLRRHEKDFFLRKDLKYQDEFNSKITEFRDQLQLYPALSALITNLDNYQTEFNNVVNIEKEIGLKEGDGIRGRLRNGFSRIRPSLDKFRAWVKEKNENEILRTKVTLGILFTVQIIAGLVMAIVYANLLTKSIKEIRNGMQQLAQGIFPAKLLIKTSEEIGQTKIAFNQFIDRLHAATTFASNLGVGHQTDYDEKFADDVLARSLVQAQVKLAEADARQFRINWTNQGIATFNDILKNENEELSILGDKILRQLIQYIDANQGALYLVVDTGPEKYLNRISTYAYSKKKFENQHVDLEHGLIGQCVKEGSSIYLKEIPRDYVKITSGLGEATPRNILIAPLKIRNQTMGVLEIASFQVLENYHLDFVERIAENIATVLSNKKAGEETRRLLDESQQRANTLTQQEEEMRQNAEELLATQEEMTRQRVRLENEIIELKKKIKLLEKEYA